MATPQIETGKNEALAAAFSSKTLYLLILAYLPDGPPKIYSILLENILSLDLSSFMHS